MNSINSGTGTLRSSSSQEDAWRSWYDAYLKKIEQYKGTSYYDQLLNNPYANYQAYQYNFWQQLGADIFHNNSAALNFQSSRQTSADEYFSQVLDTMRQNQFNSTASQVARDTAAGMNDTLSGQTSGTASAGVTPDETPPDPIAASAQDTGLESLSDVVSNLGTNLFTGVLQMSKFVEEMRGIKIENAAKDISLTDQGYDSVLKILAGSSSLPGTLDEYNALSEEEKLGLDNSLVESLEASIKTGELRDMYSTRRAKSLVKLLRGTISHDKEGKPTLAYENYRSRLLQERYGAHEDAAKVIGKPEFSEDIASFGTALYEHTEKIQRAILTAESKIKESQALSASAQAAYDQSYLTSELGEAQNASTIAAAGSEQIMNDLRNEINGYFGELDSYLKSDSSWYKVLGRLLMLPMKALVYRLLDSSAGIKVGPKGTSKTFSF